MMKYYLLNKMIIHEFALRVMNMYIYTSKTMISNPKSLCKESKSRWGRGGGAVLQHLDLSL